MKKVFLSLLISLIALTVSAQMQRTFLGCTLTSSYQDVKRHLTQEKYNLESNDDLIVVFNTLLVLIVKVFLLSFTKANYFA